MQKKHQKLWAIKVIKRDQIFSNAKCDIFHYADNTNISQTNPNPISYTSQSKEFVKPPGSSIPFERKTSLDPLNPQIDFFIFRGDKLELNHYLILDESLTPEYCKKLILKVEGDNKPLVQKIIDWVKTGDMQTIVESTLTNQGFDNQQIKNYIIFFQWIKTEGEKLFKKA